MVTAKNVVNFKSVQMLLLIMVGIALTACETLETQKPVSIDTAVAPNADFSSFKTYYVLDVPPGENEVAPPKPFSRTVVEAAVRKQLDARNYQEIENREDADVLVAIQFSLKDEIQLKSKTTYDRAYTSYSGYGNGYGYGNRGYSSRSRSGYTYGYGYRTHYGYTTIPRTTVVAENFRQGNMLIDIIDRRGNAVVWEAHASGEGERERAKIEERVNYVVGRLFADYPHEAAAPVAQ